jgi:AraC family transcriptional activator of mtrCDE
MLKHLIREILMRETMDWLGQLLQIITVTGELEIRCAYGAPWRISYEQSPERELPFHVVLSGTATLENLGDRSSRQIGPGDIVLLPHRPSASLSEAQLHWR